MKTCKTCCKALGLHSTEVYVKSYGEYYCDIECVASDLEPLSDKEQALANYYFGDDYEDELIEEGLNKHYDLYDDELSEEELDDILFIRRNICE